MPKKTKKSAKQKLWGGRFKGGLDPRVLAFGDSTHYEHRLVPFDIEGSIAHARMLGRVGVISGGEAKRLVVGLQRILGLWKQGKFRLDPAFEDVHGNIEAKLGELLGSVAGKLHSGRSRNDQVALDIRLYLRHETVALGQLVTQAVQALAIFAEREGAAVMPGYTHLQRAQPILLGHWALAHAEALLRDLGRLKQVTQTLNAECPLGAAALAGSSLPLDRAWVAKQLGFKGATHNSIDSVANRDHVVEFAFALSLLMGHLSRLGEDVTLYCSQEFGFFELDDAIATGSSLMPQKKNPDVAELLRGRTGRAFGLLTHLLTMLKGQPLSYNRDMQEDKALLFQTLDMVKECVAAVGLLFPAGLTPKPDRMRAACREGFLEATDAADHLVRLGVPFRQAHEIVGKAVWLCQQEGLTLAQLSLARWKTLYPGISAGIYRSLDLDGIIESRATLGGTASRRVASELKALRARLRALASSGR